MFKLKTLKYVMFVIFLQKQALLFGPSKLKTNCKSIKKDSIKF